MVKRRVRTVRTGYEIREKERYMRTESTSKENRTDRRAEENYLRRTLSIANANVENYGREVARMQEDIDEMLARYHDNDMEVFTILNNTVTMHTHMKRALERNEKARNNI